MNRFFFLLPVSLFLCACAPAISDPDLLTPGLKDRVPEKITPEHAMPPLPPVDLPARKKQAGLKTLPPPRPAKTLVSKPQCGFARKDLSGDVLVRGSRVHVAVFREPDLSGDYRVNDRGVLPFPLIGDVPAAGSTPSALQEAIRVRLAGGFLVRPDIVVSRLPDCPAR